MSPTLVKIGRGAVNLKDVEKYIVWVSAPERFEDLGESATYEDALVVATEAVLKYGGSIVDLTKPKEERL